MIRRRRRRGIYSSHVIALRFPSQITLIIPSRLRNDPFRQMIHLCSFRSSFPSLFSASGIHTTPPPPPPPPASHSYIYSTTAILCAFGLYIWFVNYIYLDSIDAFYPSSAPFSLFLHSFLLPLCLPLLLSAALISRGERRNRWGFPFSRFPAR